MMLGVLGHVGEDGAARSIVRELAGALPPGSYLTLSDGANTSRAREQAHERYAQTGAVPYRLRSPEQIAAFFDGLDLLEPGVVPVSQWRPDPRGREPVRAAGGRGHVRRDGPQALMPRARPSGYRLPHRLLNPAVVVRSMPWSVSTWCPAARPSAAGSSV